MIFIIRKKMMLRKSICSLLLGVVILTGGSITNANAITTNGWTQSNSSWYYYQEGTMKTGWIKDGSTWYYLNQSGVMQTGWLNDGGTWYYLDGSGAMLSNTTIGGYVLGSSGAWTGESGNSGYTQGKTPTQIAESLKNNYGFVNYNQGLLLSPYGEGYNDVSGSYVNYQITFGDCTKRGSGVKDTEFKMWVRQTDSKTMQVFKSIMDMKFPNKGEEASSKVIDFLNSGESQTTIYLNGQAVNLTRGTENNHSVFLNMTL